VREAIQRSAARLSAVELTKTKPVNQHESWGARFYAFVTERNRVARFLKSRAQGWRDRPRTQEKEKGGLSYV